MSKWVKWSLIALLVAVPASAIGFAVQQFVAHANLPACPCDRK
jgi:hypothetical protein